MSSFDLVLHAVAFAFNGHDFGMVEEPVEDGGGKSCVIIEDLRPVFKGAVGGDDQGSALIALTNDLEEEIGPEFVDGEIAEFIKDEQ